MDIVKDIPDLIKNIEELNKNYKANYEYAKDLLKAGNNFVFYQGQFAPSRFVGYKDNSMEKHDANENKKGGVTDNKITDLLGTKIESDELLKLLKKTYPDIKFYEQKKWFWVINEIPETPPPEKQQSNYDATKKVTLSEMEKEIRIAIPQEIKNQVQKRIKDKYNKLRCENQKCKNPESFTNKSNEPYLEYHHLHEVSKGGNHRPENLVLLCANCHKQTHHGLDKILKI